MKPTLLPLAFLAWSAVSAFAQWTEPRREGHVVFYADPDFRGAAIEVEPGAVLEDLRDRRFPNGQKVNDAISSIRVEDGARVTIWADPRRTGDRLELHESVRDLRKIRRSPGGRGSWDDCITAVAVAPRPRPPGDGHPPNRWNDRRDPCVILFADPGFSGDAFLLEPGTELGDLREVTFESGRKVNDKVSSVRIVGDARVILYADPRFSGAKLELTESVGDLRKIHRTPDGRWSWDDSITAVRVSRAGPHPDGRPGRAGDDRGRDPDAIITRAYRELLGRDPDPGGLRDYRHSVIDDGWTEDMVRANLLLSLEYRTREADKLIRQVFQDLLGREPTPENSIRYRHAMLEQGWTEQRLRQALRDGEEYRQRQHPPEPRPPAPHPPRPGT